jgi:hypothetical protein
MNLQFNSEQGGIIDQARRLMATTPGVQPLSKDTAHFDFYALAMTSARQRRDHLSSTETYEHFEKLKEVSIDYPIGRLLTCEKNLSDNKQIKTYLSLLNESVGVMPDYRATEPGIRKLGRATIIIRNQSERFHLDPSSEHYESGIAAGFDILTNGKVYLSHAALSVCMNCYYVDLKSESRILNQLGLESLYLNQKQHEMQRNPGERVAIMTNRRFSDTQVAGLQALLTEQFSPSTA